MILVSTLGLGFYIQNYFLALKLLLERKVLSNSNILQETYKNLSRKKHNRITEIIKFHPRDTTLHLSNDPEPKIAKQCFQDHETNQSNHRTPRRLLIYPRKGKVGNPSSKPSHSKLLSLSISSLDCRGGSLMNK